jgi:single stranded DNA-binding protein
MARMRIATNSKWRDANGEWQEAAKFHSVVLFGRLAEIALQYCGKGRAVYLEGRLRTRDFIDADGRRRFSTEVIADTVKLLGSGRRDEAEPESEPVEEPELTVAPPRCCTPVHPEEGGMSGPSGPALSRSERLCSLRAPSGL